MAKNRASLKMPEKKKEMCLTMLREGKLTKREIANKLKINSGYVYRLAAENQVGQKDIIPEANELAQNATVEMQDIISEVLEINTNGQNNLAEEPAEKVEEVEVTEENVEEVSGDKMVTNKLSEEDKIQIALLCEEGKINRKDIGKQFGVSGTTVSNIAKSMGIGAAPRGGVRTTKERSTITGIKDSDVSQIFRGAHVVCGLISERHDIPCEDFIFQESLQPSQMHDYDWQYSVCKKFIDSHITFEESRVNKITIASADLVVYMTGFQSALGALVKACFESNVNLTLMHYDTDIHDYHSQVIFSHFSDYNKMHPASYLVPFLEQYNDAFFYKCKEEDIKSLDTFFIINMVNIGQNNVYDRSTKKDAIQEVYVCASDGDAWELYPKLAKNIMSNTDSNLCLYMIPVDQEEDSWTYNNAYAKTYNFKTEAKTRY